MALQVNGHAYYRRADEVMLWHAAGSWWVGPKASLGQQTGFWRCADSARVPEAIKGVWEVGDGTMWYKAVRAFCFRTLPRGLAPMAL